MGHTVLVVRLPHITDLQHNSPKVLNPGNPGFNQEFNGILPSLTLSNQAYTVSFTDRKSLCHEALPYFWWEQLWCVNGQAWAHDKGWIKIWIAQAQKSLYFCLLNELLLNEKLSSLVIVSKSPCAVKCEHSLDSSSHRETKPTVVKRTRNWIY